MAERLAELVLVRRLDTNGADQPAMADVPVSEEDGPRPTARASVTIGSAGTHAYDGDPMHRHSLRVITEYGADTRPFSSRRVDKALLSRTDLILTATREQRAHCVRLAPGSIRRTFTLREFGRLCGTVDATTLPDAARPGVPVPAVRLLALVEAACAAKSRFRPVPALDDDLADPVTGSLADFRACARVIGPILDVIVDLVIPDRVATGQPPVGRPR